MRVPETMEFLIFEDNGGAYRWRIVAGGGATLAQSGSFTSYDRAEMAARHVREAAATARFNAPDRDHDHDSHTVDRASRRDRVREGPNARRSLDAAGSFTREAVARWPDQR